MKWFRMLIINSRAEIAKISAANADMDSRLNILKAEQSAAHTDPAHQELMQQLGPLEEEVKALTTEKDEWENAVAGGTQFMQEDAERLKTETGVLTDNIYILEAYLSNLAGGDRETMEAIRRDAYRALYIEGEGLEELEGL